MGSHEPLTEAEVHRLLHELDRVPPRSPERVLRARSELLEQAHQLAPAARDIRVTAPSDRPSTKRKGLRPMMPAIASLVLALGLVLGGGGAVFAAQDALPTDPLYPVKLLAEDAQVNMTREADARAALLLQYADRRIAELGLLGPATPAVVEPVVARFQEQLDAALRLAVEATDSELALRILARIQAQLEVQSRLIAGLYSSTGDPLQIREQLQTAIQQRLELCRLGSQNPGALREQMRDQDQQRQQDRTQMPAGAGPQGESTPGPNATPGSIGPGLGDQGGPGPASGDANGTGSGRGDGSGSAYGRGPGEANYGTGPLTPTPSVTPMKKRYGN